MTFEEFEAELAAGLLPVDRQYGNAEAGRRA